jgi:hypothetical protein
MAVTSDAIRTEMMETVRDLAGPRSINDSVKAMINKAARVAGMPRSRIKKLWYREASVIRADEADHLRHLRLQRLNAEADRLNAELAILKLKRSNLEGGS